MQPGGTLTEYEQSVKKVKASIQLFGEINKSNIEEKVNLELQSMLISKSGKLAYVEQCPWIQNTTIRNNVIFMSEFDQQKYDDTMRLCELEEDITVLPGGDLTEIGERGINLSGGQKARVSLARAIYADRDIYLLDDPLSALDSNVKSKIFYNCIIGRLGGKTRILASHCIEFLDKADRIIVLDKGKIVFDGAYETFIKNEQFKELMQKIQVSGQKAANEPNKASPGTEERPRESSILSKTSDGRIIAEEDQEQGRVSYSVYKRYLNSLGGIKFIVLLSIGTLRLMIL